MHTIWQSLAWKEWHEHKWKLASIATILCGIAAIVLVFGERQDVFGLVLALVTMCIIPLSIFVGLGAAASERSRNTLPFLQSLPMPMWWAAATKLVFGLVTLVASVVSSIAFMYVCAAIYRLAGFGLTSPTRGSGINDTITGWWPLDILLICLPTAASFFIWSAATGVNRKDEVSAGAVALAVMVGWGLLLFAVFFVAIQLWHLMEYKWLIAVGISTAPGGAVPATSIALDNAPTYMRHSIVAVCVGTAVVTHLALMMWYLRRFGSISNVEVRSPQVAMPNSSRLEWLPPPRSSSLASIMWKQLRESGPIVLAGLAGIIGVVAFIEFTEWLNSPSTPRLGVTYTAVALTLGFVMSLVIGIGVCFYDVRPRFNTFWRSRPINPNSWFWCKYGTGLAVLLIAIYAPILFIAAVNDKSGIGTMNFPDAYALPLSHVAVFAAAVAMTCLVRHAIYAAILSIVMVYSGVVFVWIGVNAARLLNRTGPLLPHFWDLTASQVALGLGISIVCSTMIAWLATRYDWGLKSRY